MGTDTEFLRSDSWPAGPDQAPAGRPMLPGYPDMVTGTVSRGQTRCPVTDQERSTHNVQLSTFNGVTERAMVAAIWGQTRNLGDRTLNPLDLTRRPPDGPRRLWRADMGTDTIFDIPIRNVQRPTFNAQL